MIRLDSEIFPWVVPQKSYHCNPVQLVLISKFLPGCNSSKNFHCCPLPPTLTSKLGPGVVSQLSSHCSPLLSTPTSQFWIGVIPQKSSLSSPTLTSFWRPRPNYPLILSSIYSPKEKLTPSPLLQQNAGDFWEDIRPGQHTCVTVCKHEAKCTFQKLLLKFKNHQIVILSTCWEPICSLKNCSKILSYNLHHHPWKIYYF